MHLPWDILSASSAGVAVAKLIRICEGYLKKHGLHGSISSDKIHVEWRVGKIPKAPRKKSRTVRKKKLRKPKRSPGDVVDTGSARPG